MVEQDAVLHTLRIAIACHVCLENQTTLPVLLLYGLVDPVCTRLTEFLAYLLELKQLFSQSEVLSPGSEQLWWRIQALELERNNACLQQQLESRMVLDSTGPVSSSPPTSSFITSSSNVGEKADKKKKAKKRQAETQADDSGADTKRQRRLHERIQQLKTAPPLPGNGTLLGSIQMFLSTITQCSYTGQAVETGVRRIFEQAMQLLSCSSRADLPLLLETLDNTLPLVIRISLPCLTSTSTEYGASSQQSFFSRFLDCISDRVLVRLIHSFFDVSKQRVLDLLQPPNSKTLLTTDPRPRCLLLISHIWSALTSVFSPGTGHTSTPVGSNHLLLAKIMRESMLLETLRHFRQILDETGASDGPLGPPQTHDFCGKDSRKKRALRLAVKETIWYLCSVLHIFLKSPLPEHLAGPSAAVPREGQKKNDPEGPSEYAPTVSVSEWESREEDMPGAREEPLSLRCERDAPKERSKCDGTTESWSRLLDLLKQLVFDNLFSLLSSGGTYPRVLTVTTRDADASAMHDSCQNLSNAGMEVRRRGGGEPFQLDGVERSMFMHVVECYVFRGVLGSDS